jgi:2-polyprenyl-3-methyl-5-hydroxy-6-metoxy-1,4-benzoquinol methylase
MSCRQCAGITRVFGERMARYDLRRYRRRGPARTTQALLDALLELGGERASLLDIGGGVGAIPVALLHAGARSATLVEASAAYLDAAADEARRQGQVERVEFRHGNFVELAAQIEPVDIVTLDRVICCYDDMPALVTRSARRAKRLYGLVYPRDTWWNRFGASLVNLFVRVLGNPYRVFVHPRSRVESVVADAGLRRAFHRDMGVWQVAVFRRD